MWKLLNESVFDTYLSCTWQHTSIRIKGSSSRANRSFIAW